MEQQPFPDRQGLAPVRYVCRGGGKRRGMCLASAVGRSAAAWWRSQAGSRMMGMFLGPFWEASGWWHGESKRHVEASDWQAQMVCRRRQRRGVPRWRLAGVVQAAKTLEGTGGSRGTGGEQTPGSGDGWGR